MIVEVTKGQQITLPASIRKKYGWKPGTKINLEDTKDGVKLETVEPKETWEEIWKETRKHKLTHTAEELDAIWERELLGREPVYLRSARKSKST